MSATIELDVVVDTNVFVGNFLTRSRGSQLTKAKSSLQGFQRGRRS